MAKEKDELRLVLETKHYIHYDFPGIKESDFKPDDFQTVSIPGDHKLVIGRTKKGNVLTACRLLIKKEEK